MESKQMSPEEREAMHEKLKEKYDHTFDMDNPPAVVHCWVDRGIVMSCEGAGHPSHRHFKKRVLK